MPRWTGSGFQSRPSEDFDAIVRFVLGMLRSQGYGELE